MREEASTKELQNLGYKQKSWKLREFKLKLQREKYRQLREKQEHHADNVGKKYLYFVEFSLSF